MTAIELLSQDHEAVMELIEKLEEASSGAGACAAIRRLLDDLRAGLRLHTNLEERIFLPALEEFDGLREVVAGACEEHVRLEQMLVDLAASRDEGFQALLHRLKERLEQHIQEAENLLFPRAEELCGERGLEEMGLQMQRIKQSLAVAA